MRNPYYFESLKRLFKYYDIIIEENPREDIVKLFFKKWFEQRGWQQIFPILGYGCDVPDFIIAFEGHRVVVETKGYSNTCHKIQGIIDQVKRYMKYGECVVVLVHSVGLEQQLNRFLTYVSAEYRTKILVLKLLDIYNLPHQLQDFFADNLYKNR